MRILFAAPEEAWGGFFSAIKAELPEHDFVATGRFEIDSLKGFDVLDTHPVKSHGGTVGRERPFTSYPAVWCRTGRPGHRRCNRIFIPRDHEGCGGKYPPAGERPNAALFEELFQEFRMTFQLASRDG